MSILRIFLSRKLASMADISVHGNSLLTEIAFRRLPRLEMQLHERLELVGTPDFVFCNATSFHNRNCPDDISSRAAYCLDDFFDGAACRREIFDDEHVLALHDLVISALENKSALPVLVGVRAVDLLAPHLCKMVSDPLRKDSRADRGTYDHLGPPAGGPIGKSLGPRLTKARGIVRRWVERVFVDVGVAVPP